MLHTSNRRAKKESVKSQKYGQVQNAAICKVAKEKNAILVVVGSRGLGTIRRTLLGSVSTYIVHHADTAVTVIPMPI